MTGKRVTAEAANVTPAQYGAHLASLTRPITDEQAKAAARILASVEWDVAA